MNITNIKKEIADFIKNNTNSKVVDSTFINGQLCNVYNSQTHEMEEQLTSSIMRVTLDKEMTLTEENKQKLFEFENYIYSYYGRIIIDYNYNYD